MRITMHFSKLPWAAAVCILIKSTTMLAYAQSPPSSSNSGTNTSPATEQAPSTDSTSDDNSASEIPRALWSEFKIGIDAWSIAHNMPQDPQSINPYITRDSLREQTGLPDVTPHRQYLDASPWITSIASYQATPAVKLNLKAMYTQGFGGRVDELNMDYAISPVLGFRAGVVDYKMSWCSDYESNPVWIHDPNKFCSDPQNKALTSAAPGLQIYAKRVVGKYQIQSIVGIYNPKIFGYDNLENGRRYYLSQEDTNSNHKYGVAFNVLNMATATEYRVSWLHSDINESPQYNYQPTTTSNSQQKNDTLYLAMQTTLDKRFKLGLNAWYFDSQLNDEFNLYTTDYYDYGFRYNIRISGIDLNLRYTPSGKDSYIVGYSQSHRRKLFTPIDKSDPLQPVEQAEDEHFNDAHKAVALAWQHEWAYNFSSTVQFIHTEMQSSFHASVPGNDPVFSSSNALGLRLAYRF